MLQKTIIRITLAAAAVLTAASAWAQSYQLPSAHKAEHSDLIARQENIGNQISVKDTQQFLDQLFKDEEEPEMDIYTEGWESKRVNPFNEADVPSSKVIDVTNFHMPTPGYITSPYGYRKRFRRQHKGVDLKLQIGDTVRAAFDGRVRLTNFERRGYGYYTILRHPNGLETVYGHLSKFLVKPDQYVKAGDPFRDPLYGLPHQPVGHLRLRQPDGAHRPVHVRQAHLHPGPQLRPRRQPGSRQGVPRLTKLAQGRHNSCQKLGQKL